MQLSAEATVILNGEGATSKLTQVALSPHRLLAEDIKSMPPGPFHRFAIFC